MNLDVTDADRSFSLYLKYTGYEASQDEQTKHLMWLAWNAGYTAGSSVICTPEHEPAPAPLPHGVESDFMVS